MSSESDSMILRTVPREKAFYFFTSIGNYTGLSASSLKEFSERIREVNVKSLEFHLQRGDFERWITEVLHDDELANDVKSLQRLSFSGDSLRKQLDTTVSKRIEHLSILGI